MESIEQAQTRLRVYLLRHHAAALDAADHRGASLVDTVLDVLEQYRTATRPLPPPPRPPLRDPTYPTPAARPLLDRLNTSAKPRRTVSLPLVPARDRRPGVLPGV